METETSEAAPTSDTHHTDPEPGRDSTFTFDKPEAVERMSNPHKLGTFQPNDLSRGYFAGEDPWCYSPTAAEALRAFPGQIFIDVPLKICGTCETGYGVPAWLELEPNEQAHRAMRSQNKGYRVEYRFCGQCGNGLKLDLTKIHTWTDLMRTAEEYEQSFGGTQEVADAAKFAAQVQLDSTKAPVDALVLVEPPPDEPPAAPLPMRASGDSRRLKRTTTRASLEYAERAARAEAVLDVMGAFFKEWDDSEGDDDDAQQSLDSLWTVFRSWEARQ
jgi:hypothetical protein